MCNSDCSLRLIAACCLLIMVTDSFVLIQLVERTDVVRMQSSPELYQECVKPLMLMRIVFTLYAINSAGVCLLLTCALMICDEYSSEFDTFLNYVVEYMFVIFGPVLFVMCSLGLILSPYAKDCQYSSFQQQVNLNQMNVMDVFIMLVCLVLSGLVLFVYALQKTNRIAEESLQDERSVFYRAFACHLQSQRSNYAKEISRLEQPRLLILEDEG